jgi:hypothetical protein
MFKYRLYLEDGSEVEKPHTPSTSSLARSHLGRRHATVFRVVDVVPVEDVEGSPYVGLLRVEAA